MAEDLTLNVSLPRPTMIEIDLPCCLCNQYISAITWISGRYYGLLENCPHTFCLFCIRGFNCKRLHNCVVQRSQDRSWPNIICPVCGKQSSCIVASRHLPADPERKYWKFQAFRECMMYMHCPFQREGLAGCFCLDMDHNNIYTTYMEKNIFLDLPELKEPIIKKPIQNTALNAKP